MKRAEPTLGRVFGEGLLEEVTFKLTQEERQGGCCEGPGKAGITGPQDVNMEKAWFT